jgi:hypothetical protein
MSQTNQPFSSRLFIFGGALMSIHRSIRKLVAVGAASLVSSAVSAAAAIITVDDFSSPTVNPAYVQSNTVFTATNSAAITYETTTNPGKLTWGFNGATGGSGATIQAVLLRDDYTLANDGDWVQITVNLNAGTANSTSVWGGLTLHTKGATNTTNQFGMFIRGSRRLSYGIIGGTFSNLDNAIANQQDPIILRATRASSTSVTASYSIDGGANFTSLTTGSPFTVPNLSTLAFGPWNGNTVSTATGTASYDNLEINVVPEPSAIAVSFLGLLGLGFAGLIRLH